MTNPKTAVPGWAIDAWLACNGYENVDHTNYKERFREDYSYYDIIECGAAIIASHADQRIAELGAALNERDCSKQCASHAFHNFKWTCGHTGYAACAHCYDDRVDDLATLREELAEAKTTIAERNTEIEKLTMLAFKPTPALDVEKMAITEAAKTIDTWIRSVDPAVEAKWKEWFGADAGEPVEYIARLIKIALNAAIEQGKEE